jgi:hypothetical protein
MIPASAEWIAECQRRAGARPVDLLEALLLDAAGASAPIRRWTGYGDLTWDGKVWSGSGDLIAIAGVPSGVDSEQHATSLAFAADATLMAIAQTHRTQGRLCQLWRGWLADNGSLVAPVMIGSYLIDDISFEMDGQAATMKVALRDRLAELDRPRMLRWTPEQQKLIDDTDRGFDQISQMDHVEIDFGRGYWQRETRNAG